MNKNRILGLIGVIILGALGSGLWDLAKPLLISAANVAVNLSNLGFESLRDDLYVLAAKTLGRPIGSGVNTLYLASLGTITAALMLVSLQQWLRPPLSILDWVITTSLVVGSVVFAVQALRGGYALRLATHYERLEVIAAPFLSDLELKQHRAAFVQMRTRGEYVRITDTLARKILESGGTPPEAP